MRATLIACALVLCARSLAWGEAAHPEPADPNHVHDHADSGVGTGGTDNGVAANHTHARAHAPTSIEVMPVDETPAPTRRIEFLEVDAIRWWKWGLGIGADPVHSDLASCLATGIDYAVRGAGYPAATPGHPFQRPFVEVEFNTPLDASAVVFESGSWRTTGLDGSPANAPPTPAADIRGTVSINRGKVVAFTGWKFGTALVVPVPKGAQVHFVRMDVDTSPSGFGTSAHFFYLWSSAK